MCTVCLHDMANAARIWAVNELVSSMVLKNNVPWAELCDPKQAKHNILQDILAECHAWLIPAGAAGNSCKVACAVAG